MTGLDFIISNARKVFFSCLAIFACINVRADLKINETTFPDENFRNWVLAQSYGQDGVLTEEEIAGVTTINVMGREVIQSLKGIEYFTAITRLTCQRNKLSELNLSKNIDLTWLDCCGNNLTELDLSNNQKLTYLACEGNQLTSLNVSDCTKLTELDCQQNQLATLNASGCKALTMLKCYKNQLATLDVSGCASLETMWCSDNRLSALDVSECTSLIVLRCNGNQLSEIILSNNIKLTHMWCQDNQLSSLNLSKNKQMEELRIYHNKINGKAMDDLINNLPSTNRATLCAVFSKDEQGVMTSTQVKAAKSKGWVSYYWDDIEMKWTEYEGSDDPVTFTAGQMATIVLPTEPDAGKGKYYRLAGCKEGEIVFEQEPHPQARVPYIIVPHEDFSIELSADELAGLTGDTVSVDGVSFIGTYMREVLPSLGGDGGSSFYYDIIDQTPDCSPLPGEGPGVRLFVGALRAYLLVDWKAAGWNDPYTQGGTKTPLEKMPIVLRDDATSIAGCPQTVNGKSSNGKCYDLQGRRISEKPTRGIYIVDGKKKM